jgi:antitoxin component YwqK of YwqJK toxin-antitoxin module
LITDPCKSTINGSSTDPTDHYHHQPFKGIRRKYMKSVWMIIVCVMLVAGDIHAQQDSLHRYFHQNGVVSSEGRLVNGRPEGYWRTYYPSGELRSEGDRVDRKLQGVWTFYDEAGRPASTIQYDADKKNGPSIRYDTLGVIMSEETYENDLRVGIARYYHSNGTLHKEVPFVEGKEEGRGYEYAEDGRLVAMLQYGAGMLRKREDINRIDAMGLKQGPWKEFHANGKVMWEGNFVDDRRQGLFKEYDTQGSLKELVKYDAGVVDTKAQQAMMLDIKKTYHPNGKVASMGSYSKSGAREGLFREFDTDGNSTSASIYRGDQLVSHGPVNEMGGLEGEWTEYYVTGEKRAQGSYKEGKKDGEWTFFHRDASVEQKGKYLNGLPQGTWHWFYANGREHREDLYRKGREDGASVEYDEEGEVIVQGDYIDGLKDGEWYYKVGDHKEVGAYKDGMKDGPWLHTYDNGKKNFTGSFVNGDRHGKHKWYYFNGQLKLEGRFSMGVEQGDFVHYNEQGYPVTTIKFRDGAEIKIDGERIPAPYSTDEIVVP